MALQSSGQIKLSEIATEFGGTAPHSLSEYYGAASGVPSSGEIKLGADFYGTSNITFLVNGSITNGTTTAKTSVTHTGFSTKVHNTGSTIGSKNMTTDSGLTHIVDVDNNDGTFTSDASFLTMTNDAAMADFWYLKIGNTTYNRRSGAFLFTNGQQSQTDKDSGSGKTWYRNGFFGLANGGTNTIQIAKMNEETWADTTLTVAHFTRQDSKGNNFPCRGFMADGSAFPSGIFPTGSTGGSMSSTAMANPDDNSNPGFSFRCILGVGGSQGGGSSNSIQGAQDYFELNGALSTGFHIKCRGTLLTKSNGSKIWIHSEPINSGGFNTINHSGSSIIPSGATVLNFATHQESNSTAKWRNNGGTTLYNFFSTSGEQINVKVY